MVGEMLRMPRLSRALVPASCWLLALGFLLPPASLAAEDDLSPWYEVRGPHLTVLTDASPEVGVVLALQLERFRAVFARLSPELELTSPAPLRILAFSRYGGSSAPGTRVLGQFLSGPEGDFLTLSADPGARSLGVVYHEFVHYLVRHNFPRVPLWFHEGLAEYYRTFTVAPYGDGERGIIGIPPEDRLGWLRRNLEWRLDEVLTAGSGAGARHRGHDARAVGRLYAVSWLLVHHLLSGEAEGLDATAAYLALLNAGEDPLDAFEEAFDARPWELEEELRRYLQEELDSGDAPLVTFPVGELPTRSELRVRRLPPADARVHLGDLLITVGARQQARELYHGALAAAPGHAGALSGLALAQDLAGSFDEAEVLHRQALEAEASPVLPVLTWLRWGRSLMARRQLAGEGERGAELAARARAALERAVEIDPSFAEVRALLGQTYLYGGDEEELDVREGIHHLEKARAALPLRMEILLQLVQLHVEAGDFAAARARVEVLRSWESELAARAQEAVERGALVQAANEALEAGDLERAIRLYDEAVSVTSDPEMRRPMEVQLRELQRRARQVREPSR